MKYKENELHFPYYKSGFNKVKHMITDINYSGTASFVNNPYVYYYIKCKVIRSNLIKEMYGK